MTLKEEITAQLDRLSDSELQYLQTIIQSLTTKKSSPNALRKLSQIKISAPPDFAENHDLYLSGEKQLDHE